MLKRLHLFVRSLILTVIDAFYPLFKSIMPLQTFRYAACGGGNTALNILIYFTSYNYVLQKEVVHLPYVAISPHIGALIIAFILTFPIGFYLNLFVVFEGSYLRRRIQLFRYFMVALVCILLNYVFIKIFVEQFGWYPTPSAIITTAIVTIFSYLAQRFFSFRTKKTGKEI